MEKMVMKDDIDKLCEEFLGWYIQKDCMWSGYLRDIWRYKGSHLKITTCYRFNPFSNISDIEFFVNKLKDLMFDIELSWDSSRKKWNCVISRDDELVVDFILISDYYDNLNECILQICLKLIDNEIWEKIKNG